MQSNHQTKRPVTKTIVSFAINKNLYERFKVVADKDMRKYSNIVESSLNRYVQSKVQINKGFHQTGGSLLQ